MAFSENGAPWKVWQIVQWQYCQRIGGPWRVIALRQRQEALRMLSGVICVIVDDVGKGLNYKFLGRIVRRTEGNYGDLARSTECHPTTFITDVLSPSQPDFLGIDNFSNHARRLYCQSNSPKLPLENIRLSPQRWQASAGIFVRRQHFGLANFACRPSYYCSSQVFPKIVF